MASNFIWHGEEVKRALSKGQRKNLNKAGSLLKKALKNILSTPGRTVTLKTSKSGKVRKQFGKYGSAASSPGDPPAKQTGRLFRSVSAKLRGKVIRVKARGALVERGTKYAPPRPFFGKTVNANKSQIVAILGTPIHA